MMDEKETLEMRLLSYMVSDSFIQKSDSLIKVINGNLVCE